MSERLLDVKSVWFGIEEDERGKMRKLLEDFRDMVNFCIGKAIGLNITSYYKLRKAVYDVFQRKIRLCNSLLSFSLQSSHFNLKELEEKVSERGGELGKAS